MGETFTGGSGGAAGNGGTLEFNGGNGGATSGNGGPITFYAGSATNNGNGGDLLFAAGLGAGGGVNGSIKFFNLDVVTSAIFDTSLLTTTDQTFTFPDASGTFALTSDIPSLTGYVPYTGATTNVDLGVHNLLIGTATATVANKLEVYATGGQGGM